MQVFVVKLVTGGDILFESVALRDEFLELIDIKQVDDMAIRSLVDSLALVQNAAREANNMMQNRVDFLKSLEIKHAPNPSVLELEDFIDVTLENDTPTRQDSSIKKPKKIIKRNKKENGQNRISTKSKSIAENIEPANKESSDNKTE